jgi:hypothetical protein
MVLRLQTKQRTIATMNSMWIISLILATFISSSSAFVKAPAFSRPIHVTVAPWLTTILLAGPEEETEGGLDLDLGDMFEMFDAADKEEDFEKALSKIKSEESG